MAKIKPQWTGHVDKAPHGVPAKLARELSESEREIHALAIKEGITTAAAAERLRYQAQLSAEDNMNEPAAVFPAEPDPSTASA